MPRDDWTMSTLAAQDAYRGEDDPLLPPPRNPAMPPQEVVDLFTPNLSRPETYKSRSAELPAAGKVPTSNPFTTGVMSDLANLASYGIGGPEVAAVKAAPLVAAGIRKLAPAAEEVAGKGIRAYHSSPHDFERFDASKIGTGEGAQIYGHGIYFAESPAVSGRGGQYWEQFLNRFPEAEQNAARLLQEHRFDRDRVLSLLDKDRELMKKWEADPMPNDALWKREIEARRAFIESGKPVGPRTYEVNINARPEQMLDWDRPLAQKTPVREMLADIGMKGIGSPYADVRNASKDAFLAAQSPNLTGEGAYRSLARATADVEPGSAAASIGLGKAEASNVLREAGIPGIRYLDQGSRQHAADIANAEKVIQQMQQRNPNMVQAWQEELARLNANPPTSNYVIFPGNEHLIDILKKYGIAGAAPAGLGTMAAQDQYAQ